MNIEELATNNPDALTQAIHTEPFWDKLLEAQDVQLDPFRGLTYREMNEETRTDFVVAAFQQLNQMKLIVRAMALEQPPEPPKRTRRSRDQVASS